MSSSLAAFRAITAETVLRLWRGHVFLPMIGLGALLAWFANVAVGWGIAEFTKILFDIGTFGFHLGGSSVALFWGVKTVSDPRLEGWVEIQLAAPYPRGAWIVGKVAGIALCLATMWLACVVLWQGAMLVNGFPLLTRDQWWVFVLQLVGWVVLAATAVLFACVASYITALFASFALWIIGLSTQLVLQTLPPEAPEVYRAILGGLARVWNLQRFNVATLPTGQGFPPGVMPSWSLAYGIVLILLITSLACLAFSRRDVAL